MLASARYDLGLSVGEFGRLTPAEFWGMWERKRLAFKRACYLQGITAAACFNSRRSSDSQHIFDAGEFVPRSLEQAQREEIVMTLRRELMMLKPAEIPLARKKWEETLTSVGIADVGQVLAEVFAGVD